MVYGQRQDLMILRTTVQMEEYLSASHHLPQLGILLRFIAPTTVAISPMSVTSAAIGLLLLTIACLSPTVTMSIRRATTMATSIRRAAAFARTVTLSVVSKNNS